MESSSPDKQTVIRRLTIAAANVAPRSARVAVRQALTGSMPEPIIADAELLISEVVTNAIRHVNVDGVIELDIKLGPPGVTVFCWDPGSGFTSEDWSAAIHGEIGGFGLLIVDRVASSWGSGSQHGRHCVWFSLDMPAV